MPDRDFHPGDRVQANDKAPFNFARRKGIIHQRVTPGQYLVHFEPHEGFPDEGTLRARWLERTPPGAPSVWD